MQRAEFDRARSLAQSVELPESVKKRVLEAARCGAPELVEGTGPIAGDSTACEGAGMSSKAAVSGMTGRDAYLHSELGRQVPISYRGAGGPKKERARRTGGRRTSRRFAIVASLCSIALMGTVAYAAIETDFFTAVFGDKRHQDVDAHERTIYSKDGTQSFTVPEAARTWYEVDPAFTESLTGNCVQEVNESVTLGDYTMTVESFVMDENDIGVASIAVSCPKGFRFSTPTGADAYGQLALEDDTDFRGVGLSWEYGGAWSNYRCEVNEALTTSTELHLILHFDADPNQEGIDHLTWQLSVLKDENVESVSIITGLPEERVKAVRCSSPESKIAVLVSPFGLVIDTQDVTEDFYEPVVQKELFTMKDGEQLVAIEELDEGDLYNLFFGSMSDGYRMIRDVPAFFIDTEKLESVTLQLFLYTGVRDEKIDTGEVVFYPEVVSEDRTE